MQVGIEVLLKIPTENRREFIQSFKLLPQYNSCSTNCIFNMLFEKVGDTNCFLWVEHWEDKNELAKYLQSDRFKTFLGAIDALGELIHLKKTKVNNIEN